MDELPQNNGNKESKKTPSEQNYVEAEIAANKNKKTWLKLSAWAALLSVAAAVILLAILLSQKKPKNSNLSKRQKDKITLEKSLIDPNSKTNKSGKSSVTIKDNENTTYTFPPDMAIEPANPGGIYENRLAVSEEPLDWEAPMLKFMPLKLDLSSANPTKQFWIRNDGRPDLTFNLSTNSNQITAVPASGHLKTDQTIYITVTGTTEGIVIIDSNGGYDNVKVEYQP